MKTLSILIPARNEEFLTRTVQDILEHIEGDTEILVGLDGQWADPGIPHHERVTVLYYPESIGQRAMTNQLCKLSKAEYVMKVDAHCAFDKGFDVKLMKAMKDDITMVPTMRNLHAFDWVCRRCSYRHYQDKGNTCPSCKCSCMSKDIVWSPKRRPESNSFCFDAEPHFQYFNDHTKREGWGGDLVESMSLQGSCFMLTREKYWELNISDESFGSWGSQGIEVACKTWLSGGRVLVNRKTWYAHMFRTKPAAGFGFPYTQNESKIQGAKKKARELFFEGKWEKQVKPLSWLVDKFWPVKGWTEKDLKKIKTNDVVKPI